ncbi:MAG: SDR family oxidoreductase [Weeksellaceae bacterium]
MKKTVFITGASSGIGKATAELFARKGWNVSATMRTPTAFKGFEHAEQILTPKLDVTDSRSIQAAIKQTIETFGQIDVVVNNAGYGLVGIFEEITQEQIEKQVQTNLYGTMNVVREILPHLRRRKTGTIINIASMGGRLTFPLYSIYHATKWAVEGFTESLWYELKPLGITVKMIEPGPIKTDFYGRSMVKDDTKHMKEYAAYAEKTFRYMHSSGANGTSPTEVAKTIYTAATDESFKLRYQSDLYGRMLLFCKWLLPDWLFVRIIQRFVLS